MDVDKKYLLDLHLKQQSRNISTLNIFFGISVLLWIPAFFLIPKIKTGIIDWLITIFILLYPVIVGISILGSRLLLFRQRFMGAFYYAILPFFALVPGIFFLIIGVIIFLIKKFVLHT